MALKFVQVSRIYSNFLNKKYSLSLSRGEIKNLLRSTIFLSKNTSSQLKNPSQSQYKVSFLKQRFLSHNKIFSRLFSTTSRDNNKNQNPLNIENPNFNLLLVVAISAFVLFDLYQLLKLHSSSYIPTVTWSDFTDRILATGDVRCIFVSTKNVAIAELLPDAAPHFGEKPRRSRAEPRIVVLKGEFDSGADLEKKLRIQEDKMKISRKNGMPVIFDLNRVDQMMKDLKPIDFNQLFVSLFITFGLIGILWLTTKGRNTKVFKYLEKYTEWYLKEMNKTSKTMRSSPPTTSSKSSRGQVQLCDVAGMKEAKEEVMEFIHYLKDSAIYKDLGAKMPRGCLLTGPPGCGKTLMAKAVANEAGVPFIAKAGSDFVEMIGGLGARRVRQLFKDARDQAPCIIFIDEIDAVGGARDRERTGGGESSQTLNQLLVEMDGMLSNKHQVVVMGATNRTDILDKALLRPGRFDRTIEIGLPTLIERNEILRVHLKKIKLNESADIYADRLSPLTPGMSGAELANICNEAAIFAARNGDDFVTWQHIDNAIERVIAGAPKSSSSVSKEERRVIAVHECGHVIVGWLPEHTDALAKVTIVPRTGAALGFARSQPSDRHLHTPEQVTVTSSVTCFNDVMCMALGGRAAEDLIFNRVTNGAADDLRKVTAMANAQIKQFGFNEKVGEISFPPQDGAALKPYSESLSALMDHEARELVQKAHQRALQLLRENKKLLIDLSDELYRRETLDYDAVCDVIGPPKFGDKRQISEVKLNL